jgi:hypothetical protein
LFASFSTPAENVVPKAAPTAAALTSEHAVYVLHDEPLAVPLLVPPLLVPPLPPPPEDVDDVQAARTARAAPATEADARTFFMRAA